MIWSESVSDDLYLRNIKRQGVAVEKAIRLHEQRCPCRPQPQSPAAPMKLPFEQMTVAPSVLVEIAERLSTCEDETLGSLAEEYSIPLPVLEREMAGYCGSYRQELMRRAGWRAHRR